MTIAPDALTVVTPVEHVAGPPQGQWTYADYAALPEDGKRYEVINGVLYMPPSPNFSHQGSVSKFVYYLITNVELPGLGKVLPAPFDVELAPNNIVQPDVLVVFNDHLDRIKPNKMIGAPDLVVEISSPGTAGYDRREKQDAYAQASVPEYWIADPAAQTVEVLILENGAYQSLGVFQQDILLPSRVLPGFPVAVKDFFA